MAPSLANVREFLRLLGDRGLLHGVDRRLRIELALRELGIPRETRRLHDLLVPLVARNPEEQLRFRELFDGFFESEAGPVRKSSTGISIPATDSQPSPTPRWRRPSVVAAAIVALGVLAVVLLGIPVGRRGEEVRVVPVADTFARPPRGSTPADTTARAVLRDTLDDADAGLPAVAAEKRGIPDGLLGASALSAALIGLPMLLALFRGRRRRRAARGADEERKGRPPFVYTPQPPKPRLFVSAEFYDAARVALRRQRTEGRRISVERSVAATIDAGGLPTLRFEPASRPPEYLILIERVSPGDHQALLFDAMVQRLRQEGMMYAERFFFERDPRLCRSEEHGAMSIEELQRRYHEHRILVFGDGYALLNELVSELAPWTTVFEGWTDRAILTARPVASWGAPESALAERFVMLPATPEGLRAIVESFELGAPPDLRQWREADGAARKTPRRSANVAALRASVSPAVWRWVCVCAVYPNLHWALTLYLGSLPELGEGRLVSEEHLLALVTLPWFRDGFIPADVRAELVDELDDETERAVRRVLTNVLALDVPDPATAAGRWHEAQMFVQAVLANPADAEVRAALEARVRELPRALLLRDPAATRRLRAVGHRPVDRVLPSGARRLVYRDGVSLFGNRPWTKRSAGAAAVLAVGIVPSLAYMQREVPPTSVASFAAPLAVTLRVGRSVAFPVIPRDARGRALDLAVTLTSEDTAIATVSPLTGRSPGMTLVIVSAGRSTASIPVIVVPGDSAVGYPIQLMMPRKRLRLGEQRRLPAAPVWALTCDASVATIVDPAIVLPHALGRTRVTSASADSIVTFRELVVMAGTGSATSDSAALLAPILFAPRSSDLSPSARANLDRKATVMKADPTLAVMMASHSVVADPTNASLHRDRVGAATAYLENAGVSADRIGVAMGGAISLPTADRCENTARSYVSVAVARYQPPTATAAAAPLASRPRTIRQVRIPNARVAGSDAATAGISRRTTADTIRPRADPVPRATEVGIANAPPMNQQAPIPNQVQDQNQVQKQAPSNATGEYSIDSTGTAYGRSSAVPGDSSEPNRWAVARAELRAQRKLSRYLTRNLSAETPVSLMRSMSYAFASPRSLLLSAPGSQGQALPVRSRRADSYDFEIHKVGQAVYVAGFVPISVANALARPGEAGPTIALLATGTASATCPVAIPLALVRAREFRSEPTPVLLLAVDPDARTKDLPFVSHAVRDCASGATAK